jgi:hypothetical protein
VRIFGLAAPRQVHNLQRPRNGLPDFVVNHMRRGCPRVVFVNSPSEDRPAPPQARLAARGQRWWFARYAGWRAMIRTEMRYQKSSRSKPLSCERLFV